MKVLFVGFGSIARKHHAAWRKLRPDARIFALREQRAGERAALPDGVSEVPSWEAAASEGFDSIWICNPTNFHRAAVERAVELGAALFVEKPLGHAAADVRAIEAAIRRTGRPFSYGSVLRHHSLVTRARELVAGADFGRPLYYSAFCGSYLPDWRPDADYREVYSARLERGGGAALDLIHEFDYAEYFFGEAFRIEGFRARVGDLEIDSDDLVHANVEHRGGVVGQIHLDYLRSVPRRDFEIGFTNGVIRGDFVTGALLLQKRGADGKVSESREDHSAPREAMYERQLAAFLAGASAVDVGEVARLNARIAELPWRETKGGAR